MLTRADVIVKKGRSEGRKRRVVIAAGVDNFDKFVSRGGGRRIDDQMTQYPRFHEIVGGANRAMVLGVAFKLEADIVSASFIGS